MAHKTLIGGTEYEIEGGRTLVNGTGYNIELGKTLIGGTEYEIGFAVPDLIVFNGGADVLVGNAYGYFYSIVQNTAGCEPMTPRINSNVIHSVAYASIQSVNVRTISSEMVYIGPIDLTKYGTIHVSATDTASSNSSILIGYHNSVPTKMNPISSDLWEDYAIHDIPNDDVTIDINGVNGEKYILVRCEPAAMVGLSTYKSAQFTKIWLSQ